MQHQNLKYRPMAKRPNQPGRAGTKCPRIVFDFDFLSPVRRQVAEAGQGVSARTDETTSHSTKLANDASQVAGYV